MHIDKYERIWLLAVSATLGVFFSALIVGAIVFGVRPPSSTGFIDPARLDETAFAEPGVRDMGDNEYTAYVIARKWTFQPSEIRVPVGARVTFNVTSADITHGFYIEQHNANIEVVPGHIAQQTVTFNEAGEFRMICHEYCGRGHHLMHVAIIVEDPSEVATTEELD
ncbi:MAG: cytochrome c oxidase subunit II [Aggregatilineales bacterium]